MCWLTGCHTTMYHRLSTWGFAWVTSIESLFLWWCTDFRGDTSLCDLWALSQKPQNQKTESIMLPGVQTLNMSLHLQDNRAFTRFLSDSIKTTLWLVKSQDSFPLRPREAAAFRCHIEMCGSTLETQPRDPRVKLKRSLTLIGRKKSKEWDMELNLRTLGILGNWEIRVREHSLERQHGKGQRRTETIYTKAIRRQLYQTVGSKTRSK